MHTPVSNAPHHPTNSLTQLEPFDDPEPGSTWFLSLAGIVVLIALVVAISALNFNTERSEYGVKVVDANVDAASLLPKSPVDAEAFRQLERTFNERAADGSLGRAEFAKLSQGLLLRTWMRYPWEDSKGQAQQLIRIPITEAMKAVAQEFAAKSPSKPLASGTTAHDSIAPTMTAPSNTGAKERTSP